MQLDEGTEDIEDTSKKEKKEKKRKSTKKSKKERKVVEHYSENDESSNSNSISNYDLAFPMMEFSNGNVYYSVPHAKQSPSNEPPHTVPKPSTSGVNVIPPATPPKPIELEKTIDSDPNKSPKLNYERSTIRLDRIVYDDDLEVQIEKSMLETEDGSVLLAAKFVKDALERSEFYPRLGHDVWCERAHFILTDTKVQMFLIFMVLIHCSMLFFEPNSLATISTVPYAVRMVLRSVEFLFCIVYIVFLLAKLVLLGAEEFLYGRNRYWNYVNIIFIFLILVDIFIALGADTVIRFSRPIRPLLLVIYVNRLQQIVSTYIKISVYILDLALFIGFLVVAYAIVSLQLFAIDNIYVDDNNNTLSINFNDFGQAVLSLTVLTTHENYPDIMYPAYFANRAYILYFITFLLLSVLLIITLVSVTSNVFILHLRRYLVKKRIEERKGMISAFKALDQNHVGYLRFTQFLRLFKVLYPRVDVEQVNLIFNSLDEDNTKKIDVLEFLELPTILLLRIKLIRNWDPFPWVPKRIRAFLSRLPRQRLLVVVNSKPFNLIIFVLICANVITSCLYRKNMSDSDIDMLLIMDNVYLFLFCIEVLLKVAAFGVGGYFKSGWNRFDFMVAFFGAIFSILQAAHVFFLREGAVIVVGFRLVRLVRIVRVLRFIGFANRFKVLANTFIRMSSVLLSMLVFLAIVFYVYAVIGMECFTNKLVPVDNIPFDPFTSFNNLEHALLTLFQLWTANEWDNIAYSAIQGTGTRWAAVYFVSFYFFSITLLYCTLVGVVIETFEVYSREAKADVKVLVEVKGTDESQNLSQWKVEQKRRRRWSRDLVHNEETFMTEDELRELQQLSGFDPSKLKPRNQREHTSTLNKLIMNMVYPSHFHERMDPWKQPYMDYHIPPNMNPHYPPAYPSTVAPSPPIRPVQEDEEVSMETIRDMFEKHDVRRTGAIAKNEFKQLLRDLGVELGETELEMSFMMLNTGHNELITWENFKNWFSDIQKLHKK